MTSDSPEPDAAMSDPRPLDYEPAPKVPRAFEPEAGGASTPQRPRIPNPDPPPAVLTAISAGVIVGVFLTAVILLAAYLCVHAVFPGFRGPWVALSVTGVAVAGICRVAPTPRDNNRYWFTMGILAGGVALAGWIASHDFRGH